MEIALSNRHKEIEELKSQLSPSNDTFASASDNIGVKIEQLTLQGEEDRVKLEKANDALDEKSTKIVSLQSENELQKAQINELSNDIGTYQHQIAENQKQLKDFESSVTNLKDMDQAELHRMATQLHQESFKLLDIEEANECDEEKEKLRRELRELKYKVHSLILQIEHNVSINFFFLYLFAYAPRLYVSCVIESGDYVGI